jgi:hypothetical protein
VLYSQRRTPTERAEEALERMTLKIGCRRKLVEAPESGRSARAQHLSVCASHILDPKAVSQPDGRKVPIMERAVRRGLVSEPRRSTASGRMSG